jgi:Fe-S cluster biogenesis protein NfuA
VVTSWPSMGSSRDEILRVLREVLAPLVRADGGEVYLVKLDDEGVSIHLGGRYAGCPGNTLARRQVIEPAIRAVAPRARINVSSGALIPDGAERVAD